MRIHMVGIGGSGMSGLAAMLLRRGTQVSGSDQTASDTIAHLATLGAQVIAAQTTPTLPAEVDLVVASAAIQPTHPDLVEARRRGLRVIKYAELLGQLMACHAGVAIAGTHGKSTTTAWLAYVLREAGCAPNFVIGAAVEQLGGGSGVGSGPLFVVEACEYDRSFHHLHPQRAAILNIEEDHLDCYKDINEICASFRTFAQRIPNRGLLITNHADANCRRVADALPCRVETFGVAPDANWRAERLVREGGRYRFDVVHNGCVLGNVHLGLAGRHNVDNALAVAALAVDCAVPWDALAAGLASFHGAHRRMELRGTLHDIVILDDYAHHPTEIRATLQAVRERYQPQRLWCVFQPHQHSRTRFLMKDFAQCFTTADRVIVPDIYFVRDTERDRQAVSAADLVGEVNANGGNATYIAEFDKIVTQLAAELRPGDLVITMGAGTIWKVADELVQRLRGHLPG